MTCSKSVPGEVTANELNLFGRVLQQGRQVAQTSRLIGPDGTTTELPADIMPMSVRDRVHGEGRHFPAETGADFELVGSSPRPA